MIKHFPEFGLEAQLYGKGKMEELSPHIRDRDETHTSHFPTTRDEDEGCAFRSIDQSGSIS